MQISPSLHLFISPSSLISFRYLSKHHHKVLIFFFREKMGLLSPELSLDFVRPSTAKTLPFLPKTITDYLKEVSMIHDSTVKVFANG
jgi:hypothetical protein